MSWRKVQFWVLLAICVFFSLNLYFIFHVIGGQLSTNIDIIEKNEISEYDAHPSDNANQTNSSGQMSCEVTNQLALDAISRMKSEHCRRDAHSLVCNIEHSMPQKLPNDCPNFDESLRGNFIGCYADSRNNRTINGHFYKFPRINTPMYCVNTCLRAGYLLAGVQYAEECFCGDELRNALKIEPSLCNQYQCPALDGVYCGGYEAMAVYKTGLTSKSVIVVDYMESNTSASDVQILFLFQLNGRNVRQIIRTLRILYSSKHLYIFHVDSRQNYLFQEIERVVAKFYKAGLDNLHVIKERYSTIWAGSSLLLMVLKAIECAQKEKKWKSWDFLINISETDFPLLSLKELEFHLSRNKGYHFLSNHGYDTSRFIQKQGLEYVFLECENRMWRLLKREKYPLNLRFDGGSDWIVLSQQFANYALSNAELPKSLRILFANVLLPVETFFHTLAANSAFCMKTVKGNLRLTNWKRKQGCRCQMLREVVDWCGCSPLVFRTNDISKFAPEIIKKKVAFIGRKFDSMINQQAIAAAEAQSLKADKNYIKWKEHISFNRTWINVYSSEFEYSDLMTSFAQFISNQSLDCTFLVLNSIDAHKESDQASLEIVFEVISVCGMENASSFQILVDRISNHEIFKKRITNGYELLSVEVGADFDIKEEIFRKYNFIFSEKDKMYAKLVWQQTDENDWTASTKFTSPQVAIEWRHLTGNWKQQIVLDPYDSIYGAQYVQLDSNKIGEWEFVVYRNVDELVNLDGRHSKQLHDAKIELLARAKFLILPSNGNLNIFCETSLALRPFMRGTRINTSFSDEQSKTFR